MKKFIIPSAVFLVLAAIFIILPYKSWLERRLEGILERKGLDNVHLTLSSLGWQSASVKDMSIGEDPPLVLKDITLNYSLREVMQGNLRELNMQGVSLDLKQSDDSWIIKGWRGSAAPDPDRTALELIPVTSEQIMRIPFRSVTLKDSDVNITSVLGQLFSSLDVSWQKMPEAKFNYAGDHLKFVRGNLEVTADKASMDAMLDKTAQQWKGRWQLQDINVAGIELPVPALQGQGDMVLDASHVEFAGGLKSGDQAWQAEFNIHYDPRSMVKSALIIKRAFMPWKDGRLSVHNVIIPLENRKSLRPTLSVEHVSIEELMRWLTGDRISGTGKVSGTLPLIISPTGKITVLKGDLKADGPGTIIMPPETIPGENESVELVRQILENLHFSVLSMDADTDENGKLRILMAVEGNNPKVYNGRAVKLNVTLTGDVLEFIKKNIMFIRSPEMLLKQENDEKN